MELLGTGTALWEVKNLAGYEFIDCGVDTHATGANLIIHGEKSDWNYEIGEGDGWITAEVKESGYNSSDIYHIIRDLRYMKPASLQPLYDGVINGGKIIYVEKLGSLDTEHKAIEPNNNIISCVNYCLDMTGGGLRNLYIPAHTKIRAVVDLEDYYCVYPYLCVTGGKGGVVRIRWAEALYNTSDKFDGEKLDRDSIDNKFFRGKWDLFEPDGGEKRLFSTLWWSSGRFMELAIQTEDQPLLIESFVLRETRYPLLMESSNKCSDNEIEDALARCFRTIQMCAHETYMDCPYYEQLMYVGDTRLQALVTYTSSSDTQLPQKALRMFNTSSLNHTGMIQCAYPANNQKIIPSFCLWWIGMVYDYALWRGDKGFIREMMPCVRSQIDRFYMNTNQDGLVFTPKGWNFVDWANDEANGASATWPYGVPKDSGRGINSILNWQMVIALHQVSELENYVGEGVLSCRAEKKAVELACNIRSNFWDEEKRMFSDDLGHRYHSEHAQCLALLAGLQDDEYTQRLSEVLLSEEIPVKTSIYFKHYLFECFYKINRIDKLFEGLEPWLMLQKQGLKTTPEIFASFTRSDCHAWGAHPLYHYFASILGIRPAAMGFDSVTIKPQLGQLTWASGVMVHPRGEINVDFIKQPDRFIAKIKLPQGLSGKLVVDGKEIVLTEGELTIEQYFTNK